MNRKNTLKKKIIYSLVCFTLFFQQMGFAQVAGELNIAGYVAGMHGSIAIDKFRPLHLRYFSYDITTNNFRILLDKGDLKDLKDTDLRNSSRTLLNYFLIGVTLPDDKFWVNLRPDSENNIIDSELAQTDIGKVLLEADLQLKKDTARLTSPQTQEGKEYWDKLYKKAGELFGYENITIPTLTRPWIVPDEIIIRETKDSAYVYKATLKVLLEQDHLKNSAVYNFDDPRLKELNEYSSQIIRETIIPKLTKEVNISKRYAPLRQVFYSLILSRWFKSRFYGKSSLYSNLINSSNLVGLTSKEGWSKTTYFKQYQKSFKDGEYNIQEPVSTPFGQTIRSYFSGGIDATLPMVATAVTPKTPVSPSDVNPGAFTGNAYRNLAEVFIGRGKVVGFEGKAGNEGELKKVDASSPSNIGAKDEKLLGSEGGRYSSEATFEEVFASGITVYSDGRFSFADQGESYQGKQALKSFDEAALTSDEQGMWDSVLDVFTHVFSRSKIFETGQTFRRSFRLFESGYNSTVFIRRVGNRTVFYVNRKWLQNLVALQKELGHNGVLQENQLPKAMMDQGIQSVNLIDSIIYAVAFHEIGGHHWDGQTRDDYGDTFEVKQGQETTIQAFRGGTTYGDFNTAAYRFYLDYAGISTLNLDSGIANLNPQRRRTIKNLSTFLSDLIIGNASGPRLQETAVVNHESSLPNQLGGSNFLDIPNVRQVIKKNYDDPERLAELAKIQNLNKRTDELQKFGEMTNFDGGVIYYPFGGADPYTPFVLAKHATDVVSMGFEDFGTIEDIKEMFSRGEAFDRAGSGFTSVDTMKDIYWTMEENRIKGIGPIVLARIMSFMNGKILGIHFFNINDEGRIVFVNEGELHGKNAVIEFSVRNKKGQMATKRFWYIQHNIYNGQVMKSRMEHWSISRDAMSALQRNGYVDRNGMIQPKIFGGSDIFNAVLRTALSDPLSIFEKLKEAYALYVRYKKFISRLNFQALLIKGANHMWSADYVEEGKNDATVQMIMEMTLDPARRNNAVVLSDNRTDRASLMTGYAPHDIWSNPPTKYLLKAGEHFGYSTEGDYIYFGPAAILKASQDYATASVGLEKLSDGSHAPPESRIFGSEGNIPFGPSVYQTSDKLGGIDFRTMNILVQPKGNFSGLDFTLPKLNNLTSINFDKEFGEIQNMVKGGIIPSGIRIKELIAACSQKEEINSRADEMIICLADIFRLEEENLTESSPELKESLVILDSNKFILQ